MIMTLLTYTMIVMSVSFMMGLIFERGMSGTYSKLKAAVLLLAIGSPFMIYDFFIKPSSTWIVY